MFTLTKGANHQRAAVGAWLAGLDAAGGGIAGRIVAAWVTTWARSAWDDLHAIPSPLHAPGHPLAKHANEVTLAGQALMPRAVADRGVAPAVDIMQPILMLRDAGKPLLSTPQGKSGLAWRMPHGVVGAMLLRDPGFDQRIIKTVATHATDAPFRGDTSEAHPPRPAALFAADHALRVQGAPPPCRRRAHA